MDAFYQAMGFESAREANKLIAGVDISTPEGATWFQAWKEVDGTKAGLLATIERIDRFKRKGDRS